jgi:hypothetical protein
MACPTGHAYKIKVGPLLFCLDCHDFVGEVPANATYSPCVMPPRIYKITEEVWKHKAPWPNIPYQLVQEYEWYISFMQNSEYLIMPVIRDGVQVYFSARKLDDGPGPKYYYQKGTKKEYWVSKGFPKDIVCIGEGVADAIYLSLFGSSIGILGSHYDGSLDKMLQGRLVFVVMDSDPAGVAASLCIAAHCDKIARKTKIVTLPKGLDPTDLAPKDLREAIFHG